MDNIQSKFTLGAMLHKRTNHTKIINPLGNMSIEFALFCLVNTVESVLECPVNVYACRYEYEASERWWRRTS